ncbi:MAG: hypothetical protein EOP22_09385 [Hyphomicrobiales bacterium]|nr:MAG: hypothetical protein EOP22_09385 [Hyphomicrobiales bacterium]
MSARFDYNCPAELFPSRRYAKSLARYRRFPSAAEAVRYIIEDQPESWLVGSTLDVDGARYEGKAIRALYDSETYPLERKIAA